MATEAYIASDSASRADVFSARRGTVATVGILVLFYLGYALLPPAISTQNYDGLAYAYGTEQHGLKALMGNHPLGHLILNSTYALTRQGGYTGRALSVFQIINSLVSSLALAMLFVFSSRLNRNNWLASLGLVLILGGSSSFWRYAGSGDIYPFAILFGLIAWAALYWTVAAEKVSRLVVAGIALGIALLAHQLNVLLALAGVVMILTRLVTGKRQFQALVLFLGSALLVLVLGVAALGYLATSSLSPITIMRWSLGYLNHSETSLWGGQLHAGSISPALLAIKSVILPVTWTPRSSGLGVTIGLAVLVLLVAGISQYRHLPPLQRSTLLAATLQLIIGAVLVIWWEPFNVKFWLLLTVPVFVALVCTNGRVETIVANSITRFTTRVSYPMGTVTFALGALVLVFNLKYGVLYEHRVEPVFANATQRWTAYSASSDLLIPDQVLIPHLRFWFARPETINLYETLSIDFYSPGRFDYLKYEINRTLCAGNQVLYDPLAVEKLPMAVMNTLGLSRQSLSEFFAGYAKDEIFRYGNLTDGNPTPVYSLTGPRTCNDTQ